MAGKKRLRAVAAEEAALAPGRRFFGPGMSPDRADAMVWAMTALMAPAAEPRVRGL